MSLFPAEYLRLLDRMGPPKFVPSLEQKFDPSKMLCACDKLVPVTDMQIINTGVISAVDNVCPGCRSGLRGMCPLICARCKQVIARVAPHTSKSGFVYQPNQPYHLDVCVQCNPSLRDSNMASFIIEELMYMRARGLPIPAEWMARQQKNPLLL